MMSSTAATGASLDAEIDLAWRDVVYDVPVTVPPPKAKSGGSSEKLDPPKTKRILHGLTGHVFAGQVVAVMGPSGSGKTSLIHVLGGRRESGVSGSFVINGENHATTRSLLNDLGYVTQEDVLLTSLTTRETLEYATRLRLAGRHLDVGTGPGQHATRGAAISAIVDRAIDEFDLARASNSPVGVVGQGGISGGEKRRLVIAMECVHRPKVLLLDEPTSGLDATTALLVVRKLRSIADGEHGGHRAAVITSIHQPRSSIMPLFDSCVLLADGREVYAGPTYAPLANGALSEDGVMGWLKEVGYPCPPFESPPDFLLDLVNTRVEESEESPPEETDPGSREIEVELAERGGGKASIRDRSVVVEELTSAWKTSPRRAAYLEAGDGGGGAGRAKRSGSGEGSRSAPVRRRGALATWLTRFGALTSRTTRFKLREPSAVAQQAINSIFIPLIVGSIYFRLPLTVSAASDRLSAISLIVLLQSFMSFDQLLLFPKERGLFLHESNGGMYGTSVYYWARTLVESAFIAVFALVCAVLSYEMFGLDDSADGRAAYIAIIVAVTMAGASFLTMIGSVCKSFEQTNALAGTLLIVLMLFDGNWINRRNIPVYYRWLPDVSFLGYAVEAAVASDFKRHEFTCDSRAAAEDGCVPLTGVQILRSLDFDPDSTWPLFGLLVLVTCAYRFVSFLGLHFLHTGQTYKERWNKLFDA